MCIAQHSKMRFSLAVFLVMLNISLSADPATVAKNSRAWRANHEREILAEFAELLSIPNLANDTPNIQSNAEAIRTMCGSEASSQNSLQSKARRLWQKSFPVTYALGSHNTSVFYGH